MVAIDIENEVSQEKKDQLYKIRHSAAHIMAEAVLELYPEAKIAIGPPIENGFYYDFDLGKTSTASRAHSSPTTWRRSRSACARSSAASHPFVYREVSADEARDLFADQPYKLELIDGLAKGEVDEYGNEVEQQAR